MNSNYGTCSPKYYVSYEREYAKIKDVRISIDKKIFTEILLPTKFFLIKVQLELKTSKNKNLDDLVETFPFQRIRFSKYCFAVESLN